MSESDSTLSDLSVELSIPRGNHNLSEDQQTILKGIYARCTAEEIADEIDSSRQTVNRMIRGLAGRKKNVPSKYHVEKPLVERLKDTVDAPIKYRLNPEGLKLVSVRDLPIESEHGSEDSVPAAGEETSEDWFLRPHYLTSKHQVEHPYRKARFLDEDKIAGTVKKELPNQTIEGAEVYFEGHRVEVYENTVVVELELPGSRKSPKQFWREYRKKLRNILSKVEARFDAEIRTRPENIETSMSTQHWAYMDSMFAEMIAEDEELQDDEEGLLFLVRNERDEAMALVDCSKGTPEFEWVHGQEAKNHLDNMKDLIMWGSYYDITPQDFSNLKWFRDNFSMFKEFGSRIAKANEIEDRVEEIESDVESVSEVKGEVQRVEQEVRSLEKGIGQQLQEVVSVVQQDSLSSSRVIEVLEEMKSGQDSLEEKLINVEERNNAALTAVVQELQEIKQQGVEEDSSDLFEETVEDLLDDSRFSSPGLQYGHLMAWDTRKQECRKILDKTVVEKSDSKMLQLLDVWKGDRP